MPPGGIRSERRLCEEVHLNLAYRWFCGLGLDLMRWNFFNAIRQIAAVPPRSDRWSEVIFGPFAHQIVIPHLAMC